MSIKPVACRSCPTEEENERLRVQLAGCGVAAMSNTHESRLQSANPGDYGYSASYQDVLDAVGREIKYREALEKIVKLKDNQSLSYERWHLMVDVAVKALQLAGGEK